ncbi:BA14K family protein [Aureimonas sp. ME7]|uniref:BA14K family protein n=1 Tax=Aureimonas sp. ME7 TaxID=2744252 RepID=UPI0015F5DE7C|nr:BA14K family protein [Aureimonas sp. ME7]
MKSHLFALATLLAASPALANEDAAFRLDRFGHGSPAVSDVRANNWSRSLPRRHDRIANRHERQSYRGTSRSVTEVSTFGGAIEADSYYGTSGASVSPSVVVIGGGAAELPGARASVPAGPKIVDIASARLDRRPYGPDGLDVVELGPARIIRIAPDYRGLAGSDRGPQAELSETPYAALSAQERAVTVYPDPDERPALAPDPDARAPEPRIEAPGPVAEEPSPVVPAPRPEALSFLEPWTPDWLRDCVARYPTFDASLGTYLDEAGKRRFCTGER